MQQIHLKYSSAFKLTGINWSEEIVLDKIHMYISYLNDLLDVFLSLFPLAAFAKITFTLLLFFTPTISRRKMRRRKRRMWRSWNDKASDIRYFHPFWNSIFIFCIPIVYYLLIVVVVVLEFLKWKICISTIFFLTRMTFIIFFIVFITNFWLSDNSNLKKFMITHSTRACYVM